jgi:Flp pilus assembly pilin Flp
MTEYILIIALIAVAVIAAVKIFGGTLKSSFGAASGAIGTATGSSAAQGAAGAALGGH